MKIKVALFKINANYREKSHRLHNWRAIYNWVNVSHQFTIDIMGSICQRNTTK
ncbi:hypothetical protein Fmac_017171 [Flemingia macrophylla]|uniref:Uncharacterized protein n=1 Tax=Flemingia macrophylla TaxID=520843 RepID=A0ABD1M1E9_9FABA